MVIDDNPMVISIQTAAEAAGACSNSKSFHSLFSTILLIPGAIDDKINAF